MSLPRCARALLVLAPALGCRAPLPPDWTTPQAPASVQAPAPEPAPGTDESELRRGIALVESGDLDGGAEALRAAFAAAPRDSYVCIEAQRWLGRAHTLRGDPAAALESYRIALGHAPGDPWLHYASGVSWTEMGELERSRDCFTRALELDPSHFKALQWRGETRINLGDHRAALDDLTRAIERIESADDAALARAGSDRRTLLLMTLALRIRAFEALGEHAAAAADRARREVLLAGP